MVHRWLYLSMCVMLGILVGTALPAAAKTDWQVLQSLQLEEAPIDVVSDEKGRQIFVLTDQGKIWIYAIDGQLQDQIEVGKEVKGIRLGPREGFLYLMSPKSKNVRMISIEMIQAINIKGAPFKGSSNAPVALVVFSDFQ